MTHRNETRGTRRPAVDFGTLADLSLNPEDGKSPVVGDTDLSPIRFDPRKATTRESANDAMDFLSLSKPR